MQGKSCWEEHEGCYYEGPASARIGGYYDGCCDGCGCTKCCGWEHGFWDMFGMGGCCERCGWERWTRWLGRKKDKKGEMKVDKGKGVAVDDSVGEAGRARSGGSTWSFHAPREGTWRAV